MRKYLFLLPLLLTCLVSSAKDYISFDRIDVRSDNKKWVTAVVQFTPKDHPNPKGALNEKFIDEVKVRIYLCFKNVTREKKIRKEGRDPSFKELYDYYHAEVDIPTIEVDSRTKYLTFLLPLEVAKRDGFDRATKAAGYVVEILISDTPLELDDPIVFENYRDESILQSFKQEAATNSSKTEGLLTPAHLVSPAYLDAAPAVKFPKQQK